MTDFTQIGDANVAGNRLPRLEEGHTYVVQITKVLQKSQNGESLIVEYAVVENDGGGSPVGYQSSYVRTKDPKGFWKSYLAQFVFTTMGVDVNQQTQLAAARPLYERYLKEALTGVPDPTLPVHMIGAKIRVTVTKGETRPNGKYYPTEVYTLA